MSGLDNIMTPSEAECFRAIRRWQRKHLMSTLVRALLPSIPFRKHLSQPRDASSLFYGLIIVVTTPLWLIYWLLHLVVTLIAYPVRLLNSYGKPGGLRAPGERSIQGVHFQFARYIDLPPELYFKCVDDWISALYGSDKLPQYSLCAYMDTNYFLSRVPDSKKDSTIETVLTSQLNAAREELSRDLGPY